MRLFNLWPAQKPVSTFAVENPSAMNDRSKWVWLTLALLLAFVGSALAQGKQQNETLLINGYSGEAKIVQTGVHEYVDIRDLARITNSSLSFKENFVVLTLPAPRRVLVAARPAASPPVESGFSRDFMQAGIEATASMREWRSTLAAFLRNGYPVGKGEWLATADGHSTASCWPRRQLQLRLIRAGCNCSPTNSTTYRHGAIIWLRPAIPWIPRTTP
jgi:hypothetical protein